MKEENEEPEGELVVEELLTFTSAPKGQSEPVGCFVHSLLVRKWAGAWMSSGEPNGFHSLPRGHGSVAVWVWKKGERFQLPCQSARGKEVYGISWGPFIE
jgi:hypothetical protein